MANKKSKWYKNYSKIWIILVAIIAVFFVPKLIDYLYLVGSDKVNTTFESKDILSFWGSITRRCSHSYWCNNYSKAQREKSQRRTRTSRRRQENANSP